MANNGTITGSWNGSNAQYLKLRCYWEVTSQSTANKTSTITLHWIAQKTTSNLYTNKTGAAWSRSVGGTASSGTVNFNIGNTAANTDYEFLTQTGIVVQHASDGTANPALSGTIDLSGTSAGVGSFSGSISLPTIATTPPTASLSVSDTWSHPSGIGSTTYVAGYTKFKLTATASATSPATVSTYAFYNGSSLLQSGSASTFTYSSANSAGSYNFKVVVTDSYGNSTTSSTVSATVNAYSTPTITATTFRCNSGGTADGSGTYASLKMTWTVANITGNTASVHKVTFNGSDTTLTSGTAVVKSGVSASSSYVATYTVTDTIGNTATISQTVQSEFVNFDLYPSSTTGGMGVGMAAESGLASFNMPVKPYKGIRVSSYVSIASVADLNAAVLSLFSSMSQQTVAWLEANPSTSLGEPFNTGGILIVQVEKSSAAYGQAVARSYNSSVGGFEWRISIYNNALTSWVRNSAITMQSVQLPGATVGAGSTNHVSGSVALSGCTPIGIVGFSGSGTAGLSVSDCYLSGNTAYIYFGNPTSASKTVSYWTVEVLYSTP